MFDEPSDSLEKLDIQTITNLLVDASQSLDVHRRSFRVLAHINNPDERRMRMIKAIIAAVRNPETYDDELRIAMVDILCTDPHPDATEAMIRALPEVVSLSLSGSHALSEDFRSYYYQALMTRSRETDLPVWAELLPQLDGKTLVGVMLDPLAAPLEDIEPLTLIGRLPPPEQARALTSLIVGLAHRRDTKVRIEEAARMLAGVGDAALVGQSVAVLEDRWEKATKAGRGSYAANLETALAIADPRPRSAADRLMGRRPWAS